MKNSKQIFITLFMLLMPGLQFSTSAQTTVLSLNEIMGVTMSDFDIDASFIEESKDVRLRTAFIKTAKDLTDERYSKLMKENNIEQDICAFLNSNQTNMLYNTWSDEVFGWYQNSIRLSYDSYRRIIVKQPVQSFFTQKLTQEQIEYRNHRDELLLKHYNAETE